VSVLGMIILIRTFPSVTLERELEVEARPAVRER
jgi:uncharacterized membrane protein